MVGEALTIAALDAQRAREGSRRLGEREPPRRTARAPAAGRGRATSVASRDSARSWPSTVHLAGGIAGAVTTPPAAPVQLTSPAATGVSWSSTALTPRACGASPGNTRGSSARDDRARPRRRCPAATNTPTPFGSWRSLAVGRGVAHRRGVLAERAGDHRRRAAPSRLSRVSAPSVERASGRSARASTPSRRGRLTAVGGASRNIVLPPSLKPIAVRGATAVSSGRGTADAVLGTSGLLAADRELHRRCAVASLQAVRERGRVAGLRARWIASAPRVTARRGSTTPSGIAPAPVPAAVWTDDDLVVRRRGPRATSVTPGQRRGYADLAAPRGRVTRACCRPGTPCRWRR